jgi:regulator of replication initiation timing
MYARVRELELEVQVGRRNEQAMRTDLDVLVGEKDSLRAEREGLHERSRDVERTAQIARRSYQTSLREQIIAVATLQKAKTQLEGVVYKLRQQ